MLTSGMLFLLGLYYYVYKTNFKKLKETWGGFIKGTIFLLMSIFAKNAVTEEADLYIALPLIFIIIIIITKIMNKREKPTK